MISTTRHITTLDLPELEPYRTLRRPMEHLHQGIFVAEGEKVVQRLLMSPLTVRSLLASPERFKNIQMLIERHPCSIDVYIGKKSLLDTIVGHDLHQAVMAVGNVPQPLTIGRIIDDVLLSPAGMLRKNIIVAVDGITNAENMGTIVRNCACFDVAAMLVLPTSCDPYLRRSVRNSMGNIFRIPIAYLSDTVDDLQKMRRAGTTMYAAHPHPDGIDVRAVTPARNSCIVFGAEGHGISPSVLDQCDSYITIPMKEGVDSLNVASASAVILYELALQRNT